MSPMIQGNLTVIARSSGHYDPRFAFLRALLLSSRKGSLGQLHYRATTKLSMAMASFRGARRGTNYRIGKSISQDVESFELKRNYRCRPPYRRSRHSL